MSIHKANQHSFDKNREYMHQYSASRHLKMAAENTFMQCTMHIYTDKRFCLFMKSWQNKQITKICSKVFDLSARPADS